MRVPGVDPEAAGLYQSISPVNTFRVIFNACFGTDLALLEAEVCIFGRRANLYDLHPIPRTSPRPSAPMPPPQLTSEFNRESCQPKPCLDASEVHLDG